MSTFRHLRRSEKRTQELVVLPWLREGEVWEAASSPGKEHGLDQASKRQEANGGPLELAVCTMARI